MPKKRASRGDSDDELAALRMTIERLADHVDCLTTAIDELADHLGWHNNNVIRDDARFPTPIRITSLPLDPTATDWPINRVSADDLPSEERSSAGISQKDLFN